MRPSPLVSTGGASRVCPTVVVLAGEHTHICIRVRTAARVAMLLVHALTLHRHLGGLSVFFPNTFTSALHAQHVAHEGEFTYATSSHAPPTSLIFFSASLEKNLALTTIG